MSFNRIKQQSLLVVTHSYKPLLNPRAFRWSAILEEWAKDGTKIDVITSWQPGLAREEIVNNVHILRVNDSIIEKLRTKLKKPDRNTKAENNSESHKTDSHVKKVVKNIFQTLHDVTWKNLYWPDYAALWKKTAVKSSEYLIKTEQYDALITISDPFTSHLVGYKLKEKYPQLKWLVDIGDPFCFRHDTPTNNHLLYNKKNYRVEKNIFAKAEYISVTTETTKEKYAQLFPESGEKIEVIPPLMAPSESLIKKQNDNNAANKITLIFVGTLYKTIRNPKFLLQLFDRLQQVNLTKKIELHFYGGINDCHSEFTSYEHLKDKSLFLHGLVPREKVLLAMDDASVLVNIGNDNMYQLPSKIVEYVLTGKPIINIVKLDNDSSTQFLQDYTAKTILKDTNQSSFEHEFTRCLNFINNLPSKVSSEEREILRNKFSPQSITKQYQNLLFHSILKETEAVS